MQIEPGTVIEGKYRVNRLLGTGGMGAVYEAENSRIRRKVAIKVLHGNVSSQAEAVQRFEREAQAAGRIGSEHICEVLDLGVLADGSRFMVMEYLEGENLTARIVRNGRLLPDQSIPLLLQVLEALTGAHNAGIIHRDLKPDNIWITPQKGGIKDFIKILDFGVSKFSQLGGDESMNVTRAGSVVGTPYYMSPEQARGMAQVDARTDVYAIGVVLYQITTGQVPYQAETFNELLFKIVLEAPPPPQTYVPDLDPEFAAIIAKAMMREPTQRFQSCNEFRDALVAYREKLGAKPNTPSLPQARQGVGGTLMLDQNLIPGLAQSQANAQQQQQMSQSGTARAPSGANWNAGASGDQALAPNASTANAWGNASSANAAKPKNTGLWIGVIAAAVVLGVGGVFGVTRLMGGGDDKNHGNATADNASATPTATQAPTATAATTTASTTTTPSSEPTPSTAPSSEPAIASATPSTVAVTPPNPRTNTGTTTPKGGKPHASTAPSTAPKTPKTSSGSGDLGY